MKFIVIGITDNPKPWFPPEVLEIIKNGKVFSGGKRHHEIVTPLLPANAEWIDITVPIDAVFEQYHDEVVVFASGDPLFFGFANTIKRKMKEQREQSGACSSSAESRLNSSEAQMPEAEIVVYPTFNSLQMLAHRLVIPYHDMRIVSLTGRPWPEFDKALIERPGKIGVLTDKEHTPATIAQRMLDYGYNNYTMYVGEHLGNPEKEKVTKLTLEEATRIAFSMPNCVILESTQKALELCSLATNGTQEPSLLCTFGIPDSEFTLLDGREKMITKMPIRLLTLQALDLPKRHVLWDIGFCTGSVSIEARLQFPHLHIEAFEIRPECETIIHENARKFGAPGINVHIGDFLETDITALPRPDAVFIGGHGGELKEIMKKVLTVLTDDGIIVFNSVVAPKVTVDSKKLWDEACKSLGLQQLPPLHIQLNENHPITILKCRR
ncbi:MAG: precorrin-6Y C5,15-methyltransferase (decarboxylating) subunit CbiT [Prevotella sp.]|nr:precorrin-6Y C5,15-methyltransferase (decarboxylating) subunit CbiT [Prevotella sp.]